MALRTQAPKQQPLCAADPSEPYFFSMPPKPTDVLSTALALPVRERARIAHELILSLDEGADADAAEAWVAELEKRAREVRSGSLKTEDWAAVRSRLASRWRRR